MTGPLDGYRVLELTTTVSGPMAAMMLADQGAEVIKIEAPMGDASRYARGRGNETPEGTIGPQFVAVNRGKRSVCLDAGTEAGMSVLHRLLENADVFLTNLTVPSNWRDCPAIVLKFSSKLSTASVCNALQAR